MITWGKMFEDGEKSLQVTHYTKYFQICSFAACKRIKILKSKEKPEVIEELFYKRGGGNFRLFPNGALILCDWLKYSSKTVKIVGNES